MRRSPAACLALVLASAGCTLVTHFDANSAIESNDRLCGDGIDNDDDGLTDCQDFQCLSTRPCCTLPTLVFQESFDTQGCASADCAAPTCPQLDPARWQVWGLPLPQICEGALRPYKGQQCYDVGALSLTPLSMHPGLGVTVHVVGQPEPQGRLDIGFTMQMHAVGGNTVCEQLSPVSTFAAAQVVNAAGGSKVIAQFADAVLGTSGVLDPGLPHEIHLAIDADSRLQFTVDGQSIGASDPLPAGSEVVQAQLALFGRGLAAGFQDVVVTDGTQCESPGSWQPAPRLEALAGVNDSGSSWDSFQVFDPALIGENQLVYGGCARGTADNQCAGPTGLGLAELGADGSLTRWAGNPFFFDVSRANYDSGALRDDPGAELQRGYVTAADIGSGTRRFIQTYTLDGPQASFVLDDHVLEQGDASAWDGGAICCATALRHDGRVLLWYAGQAVSDPTWRIGLALSDDGIHFTKAPESPVLGEGARDDADGRGVSDPEVLFDPARGLYRMWYAGRGTLGTTSIGYAVSTDGISWHRFPGNPVVSYATVGLQALGGPTVLKDANGFRMWLHGTGNGALGLRLFALDNLGTPSLQP